MIPQRIKLKGFLCYNDEQQIDFDSDATLWMLSGLNGSGKSSIFDAVTFALFGHHRGGGQQNQELINKDCDGSVVEFEFRLDKRDFRVKRTLKRDNKGGARGTQQLFHLDPTANGEGKWLPVEDTGSRDGFNDWICKNIGLNYETFTSSVLLLQGKAEKLLDSKPGGRHDVLASIVDLERYVRLHAKADEQRKTLKAKSDSLKDHLAALPEVKAEEVAAAEERIQLAETARELRINKSNVCAIWSIWRTAGWNCKEGCGRPNSAGSAPSSCSPARPGSSATWNGCASCVKCCRV